MGRPAAVPSTCLRTLPGVLEAVERRTLAVKRASASSCYPVRTALHPPAKSDERRLPVALCFSAETNTWSLS
jgi:hypothetical protein